jgi:conjugative transfer signal peptidase TraF
MKTLHLKRLSGLLLVFFSVCCVLYQAGFRLNTGVSYPTGVYQLVDSPAYDKGDLVLFCPPDNPVMAQALARDYIKPGLCKGGFTPVIKKIMAVAGDIVTTDGFVSINSVTVPDARILWADNEDRPLSSSGTITLTDGQYFMMSDHQPAISFDSRYYGPVQAQNLIGHIKPVMTW